MLTAAAFPVALDAGGAVSALAYPARRPDAAPGPTLVLAHGAGAPQTHPFMTAFARGLAGRGIGVVTFNFPYMERKRRIPDPPRRLEAAYCAVLRATRERLARRGQPCPPLVIGGKSMGGRIASQVVAEDFRAGRDPGVAGLVFLGYQVYEFRTFGAEGLTLSTSQFGASFFVLTGFHGTHVAVGVLILGSILLASFRRRGLGSEPGFHVETAGLYWHFVDIVWIVIFTILYLIPA